MKFSIVLGATFGSLIRGWIGSLIDHGAMLGLWGIMLSTVSAVGGIFGGYHLHRAYFD